jgi:hypothetical protein
MVHTRLLSAPEFQTLAPSACTSYLTTEANAFLDAGNRPTAARCALRGLVLTGRGALPADGCPPEIQALLD